MPTIRLHLEHAVLADIGTEGLGAIRVDVSGNNSDAEMARVWVDGRSLSAQGHDEYISVVPGLELKPSQSVRVELLEEAGSASYHPPPPLPTNGHRAEVLANRRLKVQFASTLKQDLDVAYGEAKAGFRFSAVWEVSNPLQLAITLATYSLGTGLVMEHRTLHASDFLEAGQTVQLQIDA